MVTRCEEGNKVRTQKVHRVKVQDSQGGGWMLGKDSVELHFEKSRVYVLDDKTDHSLSESV